jgi:calcineurin-like phosphoesterase family protein
MIISINAGRVQAHLSPAYIPDFNIAAAGDWGCNSDTKKTVENIVSKNTDFVLGVGDFSYENTADCWLDLVHPLDGKIKIAIGNHDDSSSAVLNQYMNHFVLKEQYYSFNYHDV